ncbi:formylglycine-generating enzyme family protein [bacterium]|nr:formylglycine-generating enzyme family protein [bacterium]
MTRPSGLLIFVPLMVLLLPWLALAGEATDHSPITASRPSYITIETDDFTAVGQPRTGNLEELSLGTLVSAAITNATVDYVERVVADDETMGWNTFAVYFASQFSSEELRMFNRVSNMLNGSGSSIYDWLTAFIDNNLMQDVVRQQIQMSLWTDQQLEDAYTALNYYEFQSPEVVQALFIDQTTAFTDFINEAAISAGIGPYPDNVLFGTYTYHWSFPTQWNAQLGIHTMKTDWTTDEFIFPGVSLTTTIRMAVSTDIGLLDANNQLTPLQSGTTSLPAGDWFLYPNEGLSAEDLFVTPMPSNGYAFGALGEAASQTRRLLNYNSSYLKKFTIVAAPPPPGDQEFELGNTGLLYNMAYIPAGSYMMGAQIDELDGQSDEYPRHPVTISQGFYVGKYELTQAQWEALTGYNPSVFVGPDYPVTQVTSEFVEQDLLPALNADLPNNPWRLPTEAEWELFARAGNDSTRFWWGDDPDYSELELYAWFDDNNDPPRPKTVGQKLPNPWGLYDVLGNAWERCSDWYGAGYYRNSPVVDPQGPNLGTVHVLRGGCWHNPGSRLRVANRGTPNGGDYDVGGIRLVRDYD